MRSVDPLIVGESLDRLGIVVRSAFAPERADQERDEREALRTYFQKAGLQARAAGRPVRALLCDQCDQVSDASFDACPFCGAADSEAGAA
jgi:hypothetical protein